MKSAPGGGAQGEGPETCLWVFSVWLEGRVGGEVAGGDLASQDPGADWQGPCSLPGLFLHL